jgi:hypothetical protein
MSKGRNFAMLMAVAGGLTVVAAPAGAVSCCGFSAPRGENSGLHNSYESDAQREARLEQQRAAREARKAARAAKKAEDAKARAAATAPVVAAAN